MNEGDRITTPNLLRESPRSILTSQTVTYPELKLVVPEARRLPSFRCVAANGLRHLIFVRGNAREMNTSSRCTSSEANRRALYRPASVAANGLSSIFRRNSYPASLWVTRVLIRPWNPRRPSACRSLQRVEAHGLRERNFAQADRLISLRMSTCMIATTSRSQ